MGAFKDLIDDLKPKRNSAKLKHQNFTWKNDTTHDAFLMGNTIYIAMKNHSSDHDLHGMKCLEGTQYGFQQPFIQHADSFMSCLV
jgi:hypothetical protein